jgi:hypothetical protein
MNCEECRLQFAAALEEPPSAELEGHVESCAACREELDTLRTHWAALGLLSDVEPGSNLRRGFYQALTAYQEGLTETGSRGAAGWWRAWWPMRPAWQFAFSVVLLAAGAALGYLTTRRQPDPSGEVTQLRSEIGNLRQLIALSMLQQQSAVDRLQGVTWASRVEQSDMEVLGALLRTINEDPNIDVRLAAVDALSEFSKSPVARRGLSQSLAKQTSPLMQIAVIDLLVRIRERSAAGSIQSLLAGPPLDETVRRRAENALRRLE